MVAMTQTTKTKLNILLSVKGQMTLRKIIAKHIEEKNGFVQKKKSDEALF